MKNYKSGYNLNQWKLFELARDSIYSEIYICKDKIFFGLEDFDKSFNWINVNDSIFRIFISNVPKRNGMSYLKVESIPTTFRISDLIVLFNNAKLIEIDFLSFIKLPISLQNEIVTKIYRLNVDSCVKLSIMLKDVEKTDRQSQMLKTPNNNPINDTIARRRFATLRHTKTTPIGQLSANLVVNSLGQNFNLLSLNTFPSFNEKITLKTKTLASIEESFTLIEQRGINIKLIGINWTEAGHEGSDIFSRFKMLAINRNIMPLFLFYVNDSRVTDYSMPDGFQFLLNGWINFEEPLPSFPNSKFNKLHCLNLTNKFTDHEMMYQRVISLHVLRSTIDLNGNFFGTFKELKTLELDEINLSNLVMKSSPKLKTVRLKKCQTSNDSFLDSLSDLELHTLEIDGGNLKINSLPMTLIYFKLINCGEPPYQVNHECLIHIHRLSLLEFLTITARHHWWVALDLGLVQKLQMIQIYDIDKRFIGFQTTMEQKVRDRGIKLEFL